MPGLGGLLKTLIRYKKPAAAAMSPAQASAAKLLKTPGLFKPKATTTPISAAGMARADIRTRLASVKYASMSSELEKIAVSPTFISKSIIGGLQMRPGMPKGLAGKKLLRLSMKGGVPIHAREVAKAGRKKTMRGIRAIQEAISRRAI